MLFKKKNKQEVPKEGGPNLMAADPADGGSVDLMAHDPVNTTVSAPVTEKQTEFVEQPGLGPQIIESEPVSPVVNEEKPVESEKTDAFNMAPPADIQSQPTNSAPESSATGEETKGISTICLECNMTNDPLAKFCVSCGKSNE